jgi:Carboxypeptidase regulatory-like domain
MRPSSCLLAFVLAAGFLAADARPAEACSCAGRLSPCQAFASSPIVFVGEVLSVERTGGDFHMRLHVVRALKGIKEASADLWSDASSGCGVKLAVGGRYVIYTSRSNGRMSIHACGYGRQLAPGESDPELPPVAGRVYGRVTRYDIDRIRQFKSLEAIPSVRMALDLPAGRVTAVSDQWGRFQFADVPPGKYPLSADAGQGLTPWMSQPVALPDREACIDTQIVLQPSGRISGQVLTADGLPGAGVYVRLLPDGPAGSRLSQLVDHGHTTDREGRFTFDGLDPDSYVLAVNPEGADATGQQPYAAAFFGGADRASATRIALGEGSAIDLERPLVLPAPLATRTFTVAVTCRDGSVPPALMTQAMATSGALFTEFDETGDGPVRTLRLVRDQAYTLLVSIFIPAGLERPWRGERREEKLSPRELPAGAPGRRIALVAPFTNCAETAR